MARYNGPKVKKARALGEAIFGYNKYFERKKYPPGQHGATKRRKQRSDYAIQLSEKQKAKYTYGVLERQFRRMYEMAARKSGVTGEILLQLLEARLDNVVFRLGIAKSRDAARQIVGHKHIAVNGIVTNIPSYIVKAGDVISVRGKSLNHPAIEASIADSAKDAGKFSWLAWNNDKKQGIYLNNPTRDLIPEKINEQLIIELYNR